MTKNDVRIEHKSQVKKKKSTTFIDFLFLIIIFF